MTPPSAVGLIHIQWTAQDHNLAGTVLHSAVYDQYVNVVTSSPQTVTIPALPTSTPTNLVYGAIAPGSDSGFASLRSQLAAFDPMVARGWWWNTPGYVDLVSALPGNGASAGIFVTDTDAQKPLSLSFSTLPFPAPFAIDLPASGWVFFGVPPLLVSSDGYYTTTSHSWGNDFRLEESDGTPITDGAVAGEALSAQPMPGFSDTSPFTYDTSGTPASFVQTSTLSTGTGYWIRNHLTRPLRLVRVDNGASYTLGSLSYPGQPRSTGAARSRIVETPPSPPAGGVTAQATPAAGSCGAGGLAGLVGLALGVFGLRRNRRN